LQAWLRVFNQEDQREDTKTGLFFLLSLLKMSSELNARSSAHGARNYQGRLNPATETLNQTVIGTPNAINPTNAA
jgi:hypothetical protein